MTGGYRTYTASEFHADANGKNKYEGDEDKMKGKAENYNEEASSDLKELMP